VSEIGAAPEVTVYEVGPRDGLQNEREVVATGDKLSLIERLADAGLRQIEVTSFVSPRWIPQLADVNDVDGIETHDCFTTSEYMAVDHFGITEPGESWKAVEEGWLEIDGKHPINPSGGLIGAGHPVGATGVRQLLDGYLQVTDQAGDYQVEGAKNFQTLNIGGSGTTSVSFVLGV